MKYEQQSVWAEQANKDKEGEFQNPRWSWDCGSKLDFDGGLLRICSRFYSIGVDDVRDGSMAFYIGDEEIFSREFSSRHIDVLRADVEAYESTVRKNVTELLRRNLGVFVSPSGDPR